MKTVGSVLIKGGVDRDKFRQKEQRVAKASSQPTLTDLNIRYGIIHSIAEDMNSIVVRFCDKNGNDTDELSPVCTYLNPLSEVFLLWGALRPGLVVRYFGNGKETLGKSGVAEIIGDEHPRTFLDIVPKENLVKTGPYQIFMGGMLG